jgi:hypothetical protein
MAGRTVADMDNIGRKLNTELSSALHAEKARFSARATSDTWHAPTENAIRTAIDEAVGGVHQDHADSEVS